MCKKHFNFLKIFDRFNSYKEIKQSQALKFARFVIFILLISGLQESFGQNQGDYLINGRLVDSIDSKGISDALIINKSTNKVEISDKSGYFYFNASLNDTIVIYILGYRTKIFSLQKEMASRQMNAIRLIPDIELLKSVEVIGKSEPKQKYRYPNNQEPASIMNPITFLYERYNKKYQQYHKVAELEKGKYYEQLKEYRLNRLFIIDITGIKEEDVDDFIGKCNFGREFIETASDYELIVMVRKNYEWYKKTKSGNKKSKY